jgi:CelD/BcsL family acetyltransferase involved in cellulose biosynthesis
VINASKRARSAVRTRVLDGFDDPAFGAEQWEALMETAGCDIVYLTWHWQRAWWETFGGGDLLLITAERDDKVIVLAPFYAVDGMVYFVGNTHWEADRLDFIGDITDADVLDGILQTARANTPDFDGFQLEFIPDNSRTGELLQTAATRLGLSCYQEWEECGSILDFAGSPEAALVVTNQKKTRKRENFFRRTGTFNVCHMRDGQIIDAQLDEFFGQHIGRWTVKPKGSEFNDQRLREFYQRLTRLAAHTGWLRFSKLEWDGRPIAFHYGFNYRGRYFWNKPSFAIELADRSPGQVLLRQLLIAAVEEGARTFDFGTGDQAFKLQLASEMRHVRGWGLYRRSTPAPQEDELADDSTAPQLLSSEHAANAQVTNAKGIKTRILDGFHDPSFGSAGWQKLLDDSNRDDLVFMTWHFQRAWWETFERGSLLLIVAEKDGRDVALAPFYAESGMVFFLATEFESDRLDFVGDIGDPEVLDALLKTARDSVPDFEGFRFYFVPDDSGTAERLAAAAARLGLSCYEEGEEAAPVIDLARQPEIALATTRKKSLLRHERFFRREGDFEVQVLHDGSAILPELEEYFDQHIARWAGTGNPSRFKYDKARLLVRNLTRIAADTGWLRFTRINWNGRPIAFDCALCYRGRYVRGTPSFAVDLARLRPGEVLLRQTLLAAIEEGAKIFDFRTGDDHFKLRFATRVERLHTWGLYPRESD